MAPRGARRTSSTAKLVDIGGKQRSRKDPTRLARKGLRKFLARLDAWRTGNPETRERRNRAENDLQTLARKKKKRLEADGCQKRRSKSLADRSGGRVVRKDRGKINYRLRRGNNTPSVGPTAGSSIRRYEEGPPSTISQSVGTKANPTCGPRHALSSPHHMRAWPARSPAPRKPLRLVVTENNL